MRKISLRHIGLFLFAGSVVLIADRFVKFYIENRLTAKIVLVPDILEIVHHRNTGVAFGINLPPLLQVVLFPILIVAGVYIIVKHLDLNKPAVFVVTGVIFGGALSNFIDRITYGFVVDYIAVSIYPVFNIADIAITVGIFIVLIFYGKIKRAHLNQH